MLLYLALKNIISKKSSFIIILFISFAVMLLVITNSVFDSTEQGVQETFVSSFTGDIVIRPKYKAPLSLFGDDTLVTGELSELPKLIPYSEIHDFLSASPFITAVVPQVSGIAQISSSGENSKCYMFGIPAEKYLSEMNAIKIIDGKPWKDGEKGLMLSKKFAAKLNVAVGETLQFEISRGFSARIRAVPLTAIYDYAIDNSTLDKIVLTNPETVRSLMDISDFSSSAQMALSDDIESMISENDLESLFGGDGDLSEGVKTEEISFSEDEIASASDDGSDSSSWNFLVCRVSEPKKAERIIKQLNKTFRKNDWPCEAVNWRSSAGNTAFYLYILRLILNIGIVIILGAGFIVVDNTLVINVLDRIREIGTMRAIGANKRYITKECAAETLIMAFIAGLLGCILGVVASGIISAMHITFSNSFLIQLFGGVTLHTSVNFSNLFGAFSLAIFIGLVAWIYPLLNALHVNPVQAMQGVK